MESYKGMDVYLIVLGQLRGEVSSMEISLNTGTDYLDLVTEAMATKEYKDCIL